MIAEQMSNTLMKRFSDILSDFIPSCIWYGKKLKRLGGVKTAHRNPPAIIMDIIREIIFFLFNENIIYIIINLEQSDH